MNYMPGFGGLTVKTEKLSSSGSINFATSTSKKPKSSGEIENELRSASRDLLSIDGAMGNMFQALFSGLAIK